MDTLEAIIIGIIQGLTEFLPVSSSGHIEIGKALFGVELEEGMLFTIVLHLATALSTMVMLRNEIIQLIVGVIKKGPSREKRMFLFILISMIPAVVVGLLWEDHINSFFDSNLLLVGCMLLVTGIVLMQSDKVRKKGEDEISAKGAGVLGVVQAIAILPGISRSGSTIATAVLMGFERSVAARFSFIMVLPLILGAAAKKALDLSEVGLASIDIAIPTLVFGFIAAFVSGMLALKWMIKLVEKSQLKWFAYYCFVVGIISVVSSF